MKESKAYYIHYLDTKKEWTNTVGIFTEKNLPQNLKFYLEGKQSANYKVIAVLAKNEKNETVGFHTIKGKATDLFKQSPKGYFELMTKIINNEILFDSKEFIEAIKQKVDNTNKAADTINYI